MKNFIIILLLLSCSCSLHAQSSSGVSSDGRDFYIGFVYPSFNKNPAIPGRDFHTYFSASALVTTFYDSATIAVSYFLSDGTETPKKIYGLRNFLKIVLNDTINPMRMKEPGDIPEYKTCHISSDVPISI